jgi:hypothetical protein
MNIKAKGDQVVKTKKDLMDISLSVMFTVDDVNMEPPRSMSSLLNWLDTYSPDWRLWCERQEYRFDPNNEKLLDRFGSPIELIVKSSKEYVFVSAGPNKKYDNGQGDDIVYSFNPYEYKKEEK